MKKPRKWVLALLGILILGGMGCFFWHMNGQRTEKANLVDRDVSEEETENQNEGIYGRISDGDTAAQNKITALEKDPYFGQDEETFRIAWKFIRAYEERETSLLKEMLPDGVVFDYDAYFKAMKKDIGIPLVRIRGFYEYETEIACVCEVTGRMKAENGEEVYDLENLFKMSFAILPDGSVMPYSDAAGRLGDPYLQDGMK